MGVRLPCVIYLYLSIPSPPGMLMRVTVLSVRVAVPRAVGVCRSLKHGLVLNA